MVIAAGYLSRVETLTDVEVCGMTDPLHFTTDDNKSWMNGTHGRTHLRTRIRGD
ncbi:hypothetical protein QVN83_14015 [Yersinia frederiksenii]|uniref:hypothetical protein n=1 Tax=Yersinia frederiksenii TaxID=29484 RepID=UPI0025AA4959|nr:hypothetical protein [Yersinia frederiksenii]MDN0120083.1 hypothetical protein [Yersinia frederiksenii]